MMNLKTSLLLALGIAAPVLAAPPAKTATAYFAAGCFWSAERDMSEVPGVVDVVSGYTGGKVKNPTYDAVSTGMTGHVEAVRVVYDPAKISYAALLQAYWHNVDPVAVKAQFCDAGDEYRSAIFYTSPAEKQAAEASKVTVAKKMGQPVATEVMAASAFYPAEEYHQDYAQRNPGHYMAYRMGCGRDARLAEVRKKLDAK